MQAAHMQGQPKNDLNHILLLSTFRIFLVEICSVLSKFPHLQVVLAKAVDPDLQGSFISFHAGRHLAWQCSPRSSLHRRLIHLINIEKEVCEGNLTVSKLDMVVSIVCTHNQQSLLHQHLDQDDIVEKDLLAPLQWQSPSWWWMSCWPGSGRLISPAKFKFKYLSWSANPRPTDFWLLMRCWISQAWFLHCLPKSHPFQV